MGVLMWEVVERDGFQHGPFLTQEEAQRFKDENYGRLDKGSIVMQVLVVGEDEGL